MGSHDHWAAPRLLAAGPLALAALAASFCALLILLVLLVFAPAASARSGQLAWQRVYDGSGGGADAYYAATAAPAGGVYAAGTTFASSADFLIVRYGVNGQLVWRRTWDDPNGDNDAAGAMAAAPGGGVVVAGFADASMTPVVAVARYSAAGKRLWVRLYDEPGADQQSAERVAVDATGNVYVLGARHTAATGFDILLLKYSPSGTLRWARHYVGPSDDAASDIALDARGRVYITGYTPGTNGSDALTIKFSPAGKRLWTRVYDGPAGGDDAGLAIAVTRGGTTYVAGQSTGISTGRDAVVLKYASTGKLSWVRFRSSAGAHDDTYQGIALAANGDVVATGDGFSPANVSDVLTARLTPAGHARWVRLYHGPGSQGSLVGIAPTGAIVVEGSSAGATTDLDWLTLKYSAAGKRAWARRYTSAGDAPDSSMGLVVRAGSIYAAGFEIDADNQNATVLRYKP